MFEFSPNVHGVAANLGRVCGTCNEWKTEDHFRRTTTGALRSQCDECRWAYYHANRDHILQNKQHYYQENREARRDYSKQYRMENHAAVRAQQLRYDTEHRHERAEYQRQYRKMNPDKVREREINYRANHREEKADYNRRYRAENAEARRAADRRYREEHHDAVRERERAYAEAHAEEKAERVRQWRKENPEKARALSRNRKAIRRAAEGSFTQSDIEAIRAAQGNRCYLCGKSLKRGYHIDHFIPIKLGGTNDPGNLRLACPKCNMSKSAKHPFELGRLI